MRAFRSAVRNLAQRVLPGWAWVILQRVYWMGFVWGARCQAGWIIRCSKRTVMTGPFRGMKYVADSVGSAYLPKLLGTYEEELHEVLERLSAECFDCIVDVGAAEGYYAVGCAMRWKGTDVIAFETELRGRELCLQMACENGVRERVSICGTCDGRQLEQVLRRCRRTLIIMDVEGAEVDLLDREQVPSLRTATMLVELHDNAEVRHSGILRNRFANTHWIETFPSRARTWADVPRELGWARWLAPFHAVAMDEFRPCPMRWFLMSPRRDAGMV